MVAAVEQGLEILRSSSGTLALCDCCFPIVAAIQVLFTVGGRFEYGCAYWRVLRPFCHTIIELLSCIPARTVFVAQQVGDEYGVAQRIAREAFSYPKQEFGIALLGEHLQADGLH